MPVRRFMTPSFFDFAPNFQAKVTYAEVKNDLFGGLSHE